MKRLVLDASVSLRWFLDDPVLAYAASVRDFLSRGGRAIVPSLWHLEMANGFAVAERRGILAAANADLCVVQMERLVRHSIETDGELISIRNAFSLARAYSLSSYDAAYLDTAQRNNIPLATLDQPLRTAASRAGVDLVR